MSPPSRIAGYRVLEQLGKGAMGVVFLVEPPNLPGARRALKLLTQGGRLAVDRLQREAELLARVDHPGVIRVHAVGSHEERPFVVMEYVAGESLDRVVRRGPLPWREAVQVALQVVVVLEAVAARGIVHRDIKPANLLRDSEGRIRVADFGIARAADLEALTASRALVGTPQYFAPEQAGNKPVDVRTDLYALGATLYELLTGVPYLQASTLPGMLFALTQRLPDPPSARVPEIPPDLDAVVLKLLAKEPARRYPTPAATREALAACLRETDPRRARALPCLGASAALLSLGVGVLAWAWPQDPAPAPAPAVAPASTPATRSTSAEPAVALPETAGLPAWFAQLPPDERPPLPLPSGVRVAAVRGEYHNATDDSILVWVAPGSFLMGHEAQAGPRRRVRFARGFFLGKFEVSTAQWGRFQERFDWNAPRSPAVQVSWDEAQAYCAWAGGRLPSEAEWEYAARGPAARIYAWGDALPRPGMAALGFRESNGSKADVGNFSADVSPFGAHDMTGNVREWCLDWYAPYPAGDAERLDPRGPSRGSRRVRRGAHASLEPERAALYLRGAAPPSLREGGTGLRLCRPLSAGPGD